METKWLEDFICLAEARSFSKAAAMRHVTQPAFSRRIQSLEAWAGSDLVDRSSYPTQLTQAGQALYTHALEILQTLQTTRAVLRAHIQSSEDVTEFAVPHTLAFTFFPNWMTQIGQEFGPLKSRLIALNVHDAVMRLVEGSCDILITYYHSSQPIQLDAQKYEYLVLGQETLAAYCKPGPNGQPLFQLPGKPSQPIPYLGYAPGAYLGRMVDTLLHKLETPLHLDRVYETDMAEGLKAMAIAGHGMVFLPSSSVREELRQQRLVCIPHPQSKTKTSDTLSPQDSPSFEMKLEIRAYRERNQSQAHKSATLGLWRHLAQHHEVRR